MVEVKLFLTPIQLNKDEDKNFNCLKKPIKLNLTPVQILEKKQLREKEIAKAERHDGLLK